MMTFKLQFKLWKIWKAEQFKVTLSTVWCRRGHRRCRRRRWCRRQCRCWSSFPPKVFHRWKKKDYFWFICFRESRVRFQGQDAKIWSVPRFHIFHKDEFFPPSAETNCEVPRLKLESSFYRGRLFSHHCILIETLNILNCIKMQKSEFLNR